MVCRELWEASVEQLYKSMYPALHIYALRILKDGALAEEAIQDSFCIACAKREQFLSSPNPQSWIMCTLKHVMQNTLRTQAKLKKLVALSPELGERLPAQTPELDVRVVPMDGELAEMFREELQEYYGFSETEVDAMGPPLMAEPRAFGTIRIFCAAGAVLFLAGAVLLVLRWKKTSANSRRIREARAAQAPRETRASYDPEIR